MAFLLGLPLTVGPNSHFIMFPSKDFSFQDQEFPFFTDLHWSLKTSLCAQLAGPDWVDHLSLVMLGLRSTPHDKSGFSAAEDLYGSPLCLLGGFLDCNDLAPSEFLERVQSAHHGLVLQSLCSHCPGLRGFCFCPQGQPLSQLYRSPYRVLA